MPLYIISQYERAISSADLVSRSDALLHSLHLYSKRDCSYIDFLDHSETNAIRRRLLLTPQ